MIVTNVNEIKMHVQRRAGDMSTLCLWYTKDGECAPYYLPLDQLMDEPWLQQPSRIRLLGAAENAELIEQLYKEKELHSRPWEIHLGSPSLCGLGPSRPLDHIPHLFERMDHLTQLPGSVGGFHSMNERELTGYSLARTVWKSRGRVTRLGKKLLHAHPAWSALSFIPQMDETRAALLLSMLVDPRWHVDPMHPSRSARLKEYFGLGESRDGITSVDVVQAVLSQKTDALPIAVQHRAMMARIVLDTWTGGEFDKEPQDLVDPRDFLWRKAMEFRGQKGGLALGLLRASHWFLRVVSAVWLDNLTPPWTAVQAVERLGRGDKWRKVVTVRPKLPPSQSYAPRLFEPEWYFKDSAVITAWRQHTANKPV